MKIFLVVQVCTACLPLSSDGCFLQGTTNLVLMRTFADFLPEHNTKFNGAIQLNQQTIILSIIPEWTLDWSQLDWCLNMLTTSASRPLTFALSSNNWCRCEEAGNELRSPPPGLVLVTINRTWLGPGGGRGGGSLIRCQWGAGAQHLGISQPGPGY